MHPELFHIGSLTVYTYGLLIAVGLIAAVSLLYFLSKKFAINEKSYNFYSTSVLISIVVGFLFAALFQSVYSFIETGVLSFGGMTFMGGLIGGVVCYVLSAVFFAKGNVKKDFYRMAGLMAPCIPIAHGFGRVGCFFAGCCYGNPSDSFLAVQFPNVRGTVLPTQLFEAIFLFILAAVLLILLLRYKRADLTLIVYLFAYAVFRFVIEYFRGDFRGSFIPGMTPSQFQSILMLLVAAALTLYIYKFKRVPFAGKQENPAAFINNFKWPDEIKPVSDTPAASMSADAEGAKLESGTDNQTEKQDAATEKPVIKPKVLDDKFDD